MRMRLGGARLATAFPCFHDVLQAALHMSYLLVDFTATA